MHLKNRKFYFYISSFFLPALFQQFFFYYLYFQNPNLIPSESVQASFSLGLNYKFLDLTSFITFDDFKKLSETIYQLHIPGTIYSIIASLFIDLNEILKIADNDDFYKKLIILKVIYIFLISIWVAYIALKSNFISPFNLLFLSMFTFFSPLIIGSSDILSPYFVTLTVMVPAFANIYLHLSNKIYSPKLFFLSVFILGLISASFYFAFIITSIFILFIVLFYSENLQKLKINNSFFFKLLNFLSLIVLPLILLNILFFLIGYIPNNNIITYVAYFICLTLSLSTFIIFYKKFTNIFINASLLISGFFISCNISILYWGSTLRRILSQKYLLGTAEGKNIESLEAGIFEYLYPITLIILFFFFIYKNFFYFKDKFSIYFLATVASFVFIFFKDHIFVYIYFENYGLNFRYLILVVLIINFSIFTSKCTRSNLTILSLIFVLNLFYVVDFYKKSIIQIKTYNIVSKKIYKIFNDIDHKTEKVLIINCKSNILNECYKANMINSFITKKNQKKIKLNNTINGRIYINENKIGYSGEVDIIILKNQIQKSFKNFNTIYSYYDPNYAEKYFVYLNNKLLN